MKVQQIIFLILSFVLCGNSFAYETNIYIWQRQWHQDILDSLNIIKSNCQHFTVLAGDFKQKDGRIGFSKVDVNWEYLKDKGDVTIAFRLHTNLSSLLKNNNLVNLSEYFIQSAQSTLDDAKKYGIDINGIQLDYDCPTAKLRDFNRFIQSIKKELPLVPLSITALPTWMNENAFKDLIGSIDYYVLQLHSFEIPKGQDKKQYIFPVEKAPEYFKAAQDLKRPFYLSLPTYGYEVAFNKDNKFLGLRAESGAEFIGKDINRKLMFADPEEIVNFLKNISNENSDYFKGVFWFRLPIYSDHYNWDIKTLKQVMKGELPKTYLAVDIVNTDTNIKEVYVLNQGEANITNDVSFDLIWDQNEKPIYDVLGNFAYSNIVNGIRVKGRAPMVGNKILVAWFRGDKTKNIQISNSEVTIDEND